VVWRIVSADGHAVSDTFSFRYKPSGDAPSATSATGASSASSSGPSCGEDAAGPAAPTSPGQDSYLLVGTAVVIAIVAVVTFGIILLRRPRDPEDY